MSDSIRSSRGAPYPIAAFLVFTLLASNFRIAICYGGAPADQKGAPFTNSFRKITIELSEEAEQHLRANSRQYVRATVRIDDDRKLDEVGIHLKGDRGSFQSFDDKPSITVRFDRYHPGQTLDGIDKLHLNNSVEDPTYLKDKLGSELFVLAGIPVPGISHAKVVLNGRSLGMYVIKEGVGESFLKRSFGNSGGNLYDTEEGHDLDSTMRRHRGQDDKATQDLLQTVLKAARQSDLNERWKDLSELLDLQAFVRFACMEIMLCHWDGYCLNRNNFRLYHDLVRDRIVFFPTGMDQLFSKPDMPWMPDMAGLIARAVLETDQGRDAYRTQFRQLFQQVFSSTQIVDRLNHMEKEIEPLLSKADLEIVTSEIADLADRIRQREISLRSQLTTPEPAVPAFTNQFAQLPRWSFVQSDGSSPSLQGFPRDQMSISADGPTSASWRNTIVLESGIYIFRGRVRVQGVTPLPYGKNHGACLRVANRSESSPKLLGDSEWQTLETEFQVSAAKEITILICELRALDGTANFDPASLCLIRRR